MVRVNPSEESIGPFVKLTQSDRLMGKMCYLFRLERGRVLWGVAFLYLFSINVGTVLSQGAGGRGNLSQEQMISQAAEDVRVIADDILSEYVSKSIPLETIDIEQIGIRLKEIVRYQGKFTNDQRSYLYLVRAYLSHYSRGSADEVIDMAQKAYKSSPTNPDALDSLIALALYYGRYDLAKDVMGKNKTGMAVMLAPDIPVDGLSISMAGAGSGGDSNTTISPGGSNPPTQPRSSRWIPSRERERNVGRGNSRNSSGPVRNVVEEDDDEDWDAGQRAGYGRSSSGGSYQNRSGGKLGLPLDYMPSNMLGESFNSVHIRTVNGGSFRYDGGGQMLCAFLWSLPEAGQGSSAQSGISYRSNRYSSGDARSALLEVGNDLWTNANQYRELYRQHVLSGKIAFMGANLDAPHGENLSRIHTILIDNSWPWANFMLGEGVNRSQWPLQEKYSHVMMLVDSEGTICYMGPVGGFLPMMLIDSRLPQAVAMDRSQKPMANFGIGRVSDSGPESGQSGGGKKGFLGKLFGGRASSGEMSVVDISNSGSASGTPSRTVTIEVTSKNSTERQGRGVSRSITSVSYPQAKQMLEAARVQKRIAPRTAIQTYDKILDRYPDSLEAEEAKLHIKSILRSYRFQNLKEEREKQGKYTGS